MAHDAGKVLMGATNSSAKTVTNHAGSVEAGKVTYLKSDGALSNDKSEGGVLGVSLGKSLSDTARTAIARKGLKVPLLLDTGFTPNEGDPVAVIDATGIARAYTGTGDSYVNAVYASGKLEGIGEDGAAKDVALIDFVGGL